MDKMKETKEKLKAFTGDLKGNEAKKERIIESIEKKLKNKTVSK